LKRDVIRPLYTYGEMSNIAASLAAMTRFHSSRGSFLSGA
jgi:hypothetical protein